MQFGKADRHGAAESSVVAKQAWNDTDWEGKQRASSASVAAMTLRARANRATKDNDLGRASGVDRRL
ncbi:MAG: hypothetical protein U5N53_10000 [Mycobacterium sp.]|nr:hypothetical protein [Mycobacterium sp.]